MLGKTSLSAIRTLLFLAQQERGACWSPRRLAESLGESPTYLAKVVRHLVRRGILEAEKGVKGGVRLVRRPQGVTFLEIVEACQGTIVGDYCRETQVPIGYCNFHQAALELHEAMTGVMRRWTLADFLAAPYGVSAAGDSVACLMGCGARNGNERAGAGWGSVPAGEKSP